MNDITRQSVLVLVPAYNAARHLPELAERLRKYVCDDNLLFVNDGSSDETPELLRRLNLNYISFPENRGKGAALMAGFRYAIEQEYRSVLTIDADLQHLPEEIPEFFAADDGHHVVIGTRHMTPGVMPFDRRLTNNLTSLIVSLFSFCRVRDSQSGFRLIPTEVLKSLCLKASRYDFESEMLFQAGALGCRVAEVPISTVYEESTSYINPFKDTLRFIRQIWKRIWV